MRVPCPSCGGKRTTLCHINHGDKPHSFEERLCTTCEGTGTISRDYLDRLQAADELRMDRVRRGQTLRQEAARLGIKPEELSAKEHPKP